MADGGGVIQFIRLMIDRGSMDKAVSDANEAGERIGAATGAAIAPQGALAGVSYGDGFRGKIIQAFDRVRDTINAALHKTEADAKKSGTKSGNNYAEGFSKGIKKIAGYLSVYLGGRALLHFGEESVKTFSNFQGELNRASMTLQNFGVRFEDVRAELEKTQRSFESVGAGPTAFYKTFNTLLTITGDYNKSLRATGVAINYAISRNVTYEQAAQQIGRAMEGVTTALQRQGIILDKNRDVLDQLEERMKGEAAAKMTGFAGVIARLSVEWEKLKIVVGQSITQTDGAGKSADALSTGLAFLVTWLKDNTTAVKTFADNVGNFITVIMHMLPAVMWTFNAASVVFESMVIGTMKLGAAMETSLANGLVHIAQFLNLVGKVVPAAKSLAKDVAQTGAQMIIDAYSISQIADEKAAALQAKIDAGLGAIPVRKSDKPTTAVVTPHTNRTTNPDTDLTKEIKLLGEGLTLQDQKVASAEKLDKIEAELNAKLAKGHLTLEQEITARDHIKEIETARNQPNTVLAKEITDLQNRLQVNKEDEATRARLLQIETDLEARSKLTTNSTTEQYNINKMLLEVKTALNKDTMAALENQAQLLHAMAGFQETRDEAIKRGAAMLLTIKTRLEDVNLSERERVRLLQLQNQIIADSKDPIKETEKETKATITNIRQARTVAERDAAVAKLRELTAALREMVKDPNNSPADVARLKAAMNAAQKELDKNPLHAKGFLKDLHDTLEKDLPDIAEGAASNMVDAFDHGFQLLLTGAANVRTALGSIATGMAKGVAKELADMAKLKVKENLAWAIEALAKGFQLSANPLTAPAAAVEFKAAAGFLAAAGKWELLAGVAGAASSTGSGGAAGAGSSANKTAQTVKPSAPEIHIHVDGIDPKNPRHQELAANTVQQYVERTGGTLLVGK